MINNLEHNGTSSPSKVADMALNSYSFELENDLSQLEILRQHLIKLGHTVGLTEAFITDVNVCLDELFTNTVSYGYTDDKKHFIRFEIQTDEKAQTIRIEDEGVPFNPLLKKDPEPPNDLLDARIGGLGIHIVKKLMDDISYERVGGKNVLTIKKNI